MPKNIIKTLSIFLASLVAFAFVACSNVNEKNELSIYVCDSPADYTSVTFRIASVDVRSAGSDAWTNLASENAQVSLMELVNGNTESIARLVMPIGGVYDAVRFTFSNENARVGISGVGYVMTLDPADAVVVVEFPAVTMNGEDTPLLFDIDVASSVVEIVVANTTPNETQEETDGETGDGTEEEEEEEEPEPVIRNFRFAPQVTFVDTNECGVVKGGLQIGEDTPVSSRVWMRFTNNATGVVSSTYCLSNASLGDSKGAFFIRLLPGEYTLVVEPSQKKEFKTYTAIVSVTKQGITDLKYIHLEPTITE